MGSREEHDQEKLQTFLETCMSKEVIENGCIAADVNQSQVKLHCTKADF